MSFAARCKTQADAIAHLRAETNYVSGAVAPVQIEKVYHKRICWKRLHNLYYDVVSQSIGKKHGLRRP